MDTRQVVERHLESLLAGDVGRTLEDYTEESVLLTAGMVIRGLDQLRGVFDEACSTIFKPGTYEFTLDGMVIDGDHALITWRLEFEGGEAPFGFDSFYVRDGKILAQTGGLYIPEA